MADVKVDGVRVRFGDFTAVDDVSFELPSGQTLALLGPSGCGKTTLLNTISGFIKPDSGRLEVGGRDITHVPTRRRGLSMVFQSHALFPHLSVRDNVAFGLRVRRTAGAEAERRIRDALELVRLDALAGRFPHELSGGQRQRVALARALVVRPAVMLLDEPLSSLDAKLRTELRVELHELQEATGVTMVYVTHDKEEAFSLGDRIGVMRDGVLAQLGTPEEIFSRPSSPFVATFVSDANLLPGVVAQADGAHAAIALDGGDATVPCRNPHGLAPGAAVSVAVAPAALRIADDAASGVAAQVRVSQFMGSRIELVCEIGGHDVLAALDAFRTGRAGRRLAHGDTTWLTWDPDDAVALAPEEGAAAARRARSRAVVAA